MFDVRRPIVRIPVVVGVSLIAGAIAGQLAGFATGIQWLVVTGLLLEIGFCVWFLGDFGA